MYVYSCVCQDTVIQFS